MASSAFHLGFWLTNLYVPGEPSTFSLTSPSGSWDFHRHPDYETTKDAFLNNGLAGPTYAAETSGSVGNSRSTAVDAAFKELLPICLGTSYLTGLSVTPCASTMMSEVSFVTVGPHFPRVRSMGSGHPVVTRELELKQLAESFIVAWFSVGAAEKIRLLSHHWLDALAYWSLEDLVLSSGTILEIIADTASAHSAASGSGTAVTTFNQRIGHAATRFNLSPLPPDFRKMRNDLVHEGTLSGTNFPGKDVQDCAIAAGQTLDWIDQYIFAALSLGSVPQLRFRHGFPAINSFSL